ncbi:MAG: UpxY family transcription antiterminator [Bacteroidales bacterium]|nr:UpxY family transcription antiterminator [Bacteroidales bacterium]
MGYTITYNWYAVYVRSRAEKAVYDSFIDQGFEAFLPLERKLRKWSDRKKWVDVPYINSYVFVKSSEKEYFDVLNTFHVVRYVTFEGKAAIIPEWQIDAMRKIVNSKETFHFSSHHFQKGEKIVIDSGALVGYKGEVIHDSDGKKKVLIRIEQIGYSLVVEMDILEVKKVKS